MSHLANKMGPFVVGPIFADAFLKSFLPPPLVPLAFLFAVGMFIPLVNMLSKPETESKYYKVFVSSDPCHSIFLGLIFPFQIEIISQHLQNLTIKNTSGTTDQAPHSSFPFTVLFPELCTCAIIQYLSPKLQTAITHSILNQLLSFLGCGLAFIQTRCM